MPLSRIGEQQHPEERTAGLKTKITYRYHLVVGVTLVHGLSSMIRQEGPRMDSGHIYLVCYDLVWVFLSGLMQQLVPGWRWTGGRAVGTLCPPLGSSALPALLLASHHHRPVRPLLGSRSHGAWWQPWWQQQQDDEPAPPPICALSGQLTNGSQYDRSS